MDTTEEIRRIKKDMDISQHKYPVFWSVIKKDFNKKNINPNLCCPMNYLYNLSIPEFHSSKTTLPMSYFFLKPSVTVNRKTCKKVEELISKYSMKLFEYNINESNDEGYLLLRNDFNDMLNDIQKIRISRNYIGLFAWLIDRAFVITPQVFRNNMKIRSTISKNKSILLKTLYQVNSASLLKCLSKNC